MRALRRVIARPGARLTAGVLVACGAIGAGLVPLLGSSPGRSRARSSRTAQASGTPVLPAPAPGFAIPKPSGLADPTGETRWAPVLHSSAVRLAPSASSPVVNQVSTVTPEGTANLIVATAELTRDRVTWVRASLPSLTGRGAEGWLPRSSLGGWSFVNTRLVIDRRRLTLTLYRGSRAIFSARVGIGTATNPTPAGSFYVRDRLTSFASPEYGPLAFGTSARAPYLTGWPDGGYIGIHGTDQPGLIPGRISHGCIRLTDPKIRRLGQLLAVGTPVIVS
ncbi:MAG: L,D-transpeptidase [Solirubrobacteraceae bacterium]